MCTHIFIYIYIYVCIKKYTDIHTHTHIHTYIHMYTSGVPLCEHFCMHESTSRAAVCDDCHLCIYKCSQYALNMLSICMYACIYVDMYVYIYMYVCMYVCVYIPLCI